MNAVLHPSFTALPIQCPHMKATDVITRDHRAAEVLFEEFKAAAEEDKREIEKKIFSALTAHELMEDTHFYPALLKKGADDKELQNMIAEQLKLEASTTGIRALEKVTGEHDERLLEVMDNVLAHAKKEESEILPKAEEWFTEEELEEMGAKMEPDSAVAKA